jgi:hypothetical protein
MAASGRRVVNYAIQAMDHIDTTVEGTNLGHVGYA